MWIFLLLFASAQTPAAATPSPAPTSQSSELPPAPSAGVQAERAAQTVRELVALGPRMGGTPSGEKSVEYLVQRFEAMGLPTRVLAEKEQLVHWEDSWSLVAEFSPQDGSAPATIPIHKSWPYGFSPSAEGEATIALDAEVGQVGLFEGFHSPPRKGPKLVAALVDGYNTKPGDWPKLRPLRSSANNRYPVFGISAEDGAHLREALQRKGTVRLKFALDAHIESRASKSVEARLVGREGAPPGFFLVCAHGDSDAGGPGANDNGSGVAIVLEMAQAWKTAIDAGLTPGPAREVRFVIWGSEIRSTRQYLDRVLASEGENLLGVLNFDQAGFGAGAEQLNVEPDDLEGNRAMVRMATQVMQRHRDLQGFPKRWATNRSLGGTDSYVFSSSELFRERGLPAVTLFTSAWDKPEEHPRTPDMPGESWGERDLVGVDYDPYYHSAGDRPELTTDLESHNMVWCARVGLMTLIEYLDSLQ